MRHLLMPVENGYFSKTFLFLFGIVIRQDVVNNDSPQRPLFLYLQVIFDSLSTLFVSALSFIHMNSLCRLLTVFLCLSLLSDLRFSSNEILDNPIAGFSSSLRKLVSIYINIGRQLSNLLQEVISLFLTNINYHFKLCLFFSSLLPVYNFTFK